VKLTPALLPAKQSPFIRIHPVTPTGVCSWSISTIANHPRWLVCACSKHASSPESRECAL
jgi:hypothetical protein